MYLGSAWFFKCEYFVQESIGGDLLELVLEGFYEVITVVFSEGWLENKLEGELGSGHFVTVLVVLGDVRKTDVLNEWSS